MWGAFFIATLRYSIVRMFRCSFVRTTEQLNNCHSAKLNEIPRCARNDPAYIREGTKKGGKAAFLCSFIHHHRLVISNVVRNLILVNSQKRIGNRECFVQLYELRHFDILLFECSDVRLFEQLNNWIIEQLPNPKSSNPKSCYHNTLYLIHCTQPSYKYNSFLFIIQHKNSSSPVSHISHLTSHFAPCFFSLCL